MIYPIVRDNCSSNSGWFSCFCGATIHDPEGSLYRRVLLQKRTVDWHSDRNDRTSTCINIGKLNLKISPNQACTVTNAELTGEAARSNGYSMIFNHKNGGLNTSWHDPPDSSLFFTNRNFHFQCSKVTPPIFLDIRCMTLLCSATPRLGQPVARQALFGWASEKASCSSGLRISPAYDRPY